MIFNPFVSCFAVVFILLSPADCKSSPVVTGAYPVPAVETKKQVTKFLHGTGFEISDDSLTAGAMSLDFTKNEEKLHILINPKSPLASIVEVYSPLKIAKASPAINGLIASLDAYVMNVHREKRAVPQDIPLQVQLRDHSVVCLSTFVHGETVSFSGFAIDRRGLILSTAHDLEDIDTVTVFLGNGEQLTGKIVRRNSLADLILIKVNTSFADFVPLGNGRSRLKTGDKVISMVCPVTGRRNIQIGLVDEPPALVEGQPLWQVNLSVAHGDSGGPVFDMKGRLVGVVKGRFRGTANRGFLIPFETIRDFLWLEQK